MISKACVLMLALVTGACNLLTTDAVASLTVAVNSATQLTGAMAARVRRANKRSSTRSTIPEGLPASRSRSPANARGKRFVAPDFVDTSPQFTVPDSGLLTP